MEKDTKPIDLIKKGVLVGIGIDFKTTVLVATHSEWSESHTPPGSE